MNSTSSVPFLILSLAMLSLKVPTGWIFAFSYIFLLFFIDFITYVYNLQSYIFSFVLFELYMNRKQDFLWLFTVITCLISECCHRYNFKKNTSKTPHFPKFSLLMLPLSVNWKKKNKSNAACF